MSEGRVVSDSQSLYVWVTVWSSAGSAQGICYKAHACFITHALAVYHQLIGFGCNQTNDDVLQPSVSTDTTAIMISNASNPQPAAGSLP